MNRATAAILFVVALAGLTATGAVDTLPAPAENVELTPSDGPNAEFATLTDDERLALNVRRLNGGAETRIAAVFSVTYTGENPIEVWLTDESDAVTFTSLAASVENEANAVRLTPGESISVGLRIDTTGAVPSLSEFTVNARIADGNGQRPVRVDRPAPGFVEVEAPNVPPNTPVTADVRGADTQPGFVIEEISVTTTRSTTVSLNVSTRSDAGSTAPPVDVPNRPASEEQAIGYVNVSHDTPDEAIAGASFRFTVQKSTLDARGLDPTDVQLYRFADGAWNPVPTSVVGESPDAVRFRADSPGLSVFAVAPDPGEPDTGAPPSAPDQPDDTPTDTPADDPTATPTDTPADDPTTTSTETPSDTPTESPTAASTETATDEPTATEPPTGEPFGFPIGPVTVVAAIVAALVVIGLYRV